MKLPDVKMFTCMCGASFLGTEENFDQHLKIDCPVYQEAWRKLSQKPPNTLPDTPVAGGEMKK